MLLFDFTVLLPSLLAAIFATTVAVLAFRLKRRQIERNKVQALQTAQTLGITYSEKDIFGLAPQLKAFELFRHSRRSWGRKSQVTNILRGQVGDTEVFQFDYSYLVSTGKAVVRISQTVFFANDKHWSLPDFRLRPEQWWHKVLAKIGASSDIDFPENADFSNHFYLTSSLEELARTKFGPELQRFLLGGPRIHLEGSNYYLIAYHPRKILRGEEARLFYERCCRLTALLKGGEKQTLLDLTELKKVEELQPVAIQQNPAKRGLNEKE